MEKRINLFKKVEAFGQLDEQLKKINLYGVAGATLLFIIFLGLFAYNVFLNASVSTFTKEKSSLTAQLSQNDTQYKINYISSKTDQIKLLNKNDAHFSLYYEMLKTVFDQNSIPIFTTFKIDNQQNVNMSFDISTYDDFQKIIGFIQTDTFLSHFKTLTIQTASFSQGQSTTKDVLQLVGVAKNVNTEI